MVQASSEPPLSHAVLLPRSSESARPQGSGARHCPNGNYSDRAAIPPVEREGRNTSHATSPSALATLAFFANKLVCLTSKRAPLGGENGAAFLRNTLSSVCLCRLSLCRLSRQARMLQRADLPAPISTDNSLRVAVMSNRGPASVWCRTLGLTIFFLITSLSSGCLWCCPWGWHRHHCCYEPASADLLQRGQGPVASNAAPIP
jgi:hypothetical protein